MAQPMASAQVKAVSQYIQASKPPNSLHTSHDTQVNIVDITSSLLWQLAIDHPMLRLLDSVSHIVMQSKRVCFLGVCICLSKLIQTAHVLMTSE